MYRITRSVCLVKQNHHQIDFMLQSLRFLLLYLQQLSCSIIKMRLQGKCPLVNLLHIFGTPIHKYTTGGLLVGGMISMSTFLV